MTEILINEIKEQPEVVETLISKEIDTIQNIVKKIEGKFDCIQIAARGTSDNAARYARYLLGSHNRIQVTLATPSLYTIYEQPPALKNALVIGISQSGKSPDIVAVLKEARNQKLPTLCITNSPNSPLADVSDFVVPLHAGTEKAVAATKSYTASLTVLALISVFLKKDRAHLEEIKKLPGLLSKTLASSLNIVPAAVRYRYMDHGVVISRGYNYATAFEIALKIKELSSVIVEPYSSADFKHGPIASIHPGFPVILIAPAGRMYPHIEDFAKMLKQIGAELIIISNEDKILQIGNLSFRMPAEIPEWISPIPFVIPGQLFGRQIAFEKNMNIDNPEGLSKITETF